MTLDKTFTYRLHVLHKLTDMQTQRAYEQDAGVSLSDGRCLSVVGSFGPLSVNELAFKSNLTKGQASRAAQALVDQKLVEKDVSDSDGRGVVLRLSAKGKKQFDRIMAVVNERNLEILSSLSESEQQQLSDYIDRLVVAASATNKNSAAK